MSIELAQGVARMYIAKLVGEALIFIFPAYCANGAPVLAGGGLPMDFGRKLRDGKPVFGKNKTFRGFFAGLIVGAFVGLVEGFVFNYPFLLGLLTTLGALVGDLTGAFLKRRLSIPPGGLFPIVDQLDFVVGALAFSLLSFPHTVPLELAVAVLIVTPPIHLLMNYTAYKLGLKDNPW